MYRLTDKAKNLDKVIIQHVISGDYDYTDRENIEAAINEIADDIHSAGYLLGGYDEAKREAESTLQAYTIDEVLQNAEAGYGWPIDLGYVEEVEDNE